jgi:hypothetical protein
MSQSLILPMTDSRDVISSHSCVNGILVAILSGYPYPNAYLTGKCFRINKDTVTLSFT